MSDRLRHVGVALAAALLVTPPSVAAAEDAAAEDDRLIALRLADFLRAGRNVVSAYQETINDPALGDKGFTPEAFAAEAEAAFAAKWSLEPNDPTLPDRDRRLLEALATAMENVVAEHQDDINRPGVGFKGFIPAVFARLSGEGFAALSEGDATIRVTAPAELVRNRRARPDAWERQVIETRFLAPDWPQGAPHSEVLDVSGRPAFRIMIPEYYQESCLVCHGGPKGELDITGYPKEGGAAGDLGAAISITIFR